MLDIVAIPRPGLSAPFAPSRRGYRACVRSLINEARLLRAFQTSRVAIATLGDGITEFGSHRENRVLGTPVKRGCQGSFRSYGLVGAVWAGVGARTKSWLTCGNGREAASALACCRAR